MKSTTFPAAAVVYLENLASPGKSTNTLKSYGNVLTRGDEMEYYYRVTD